MAGWWEVIEVRGGDEDERARCTGCLEIPLRPARELELRTSSARLHHPHPALPQPRFPTVRPTSPDDFFFYLCTYNNKILSAAADYLLPTCKRSGTSVLCPLVRPSRGREKKLPFSSSSFLKAFLSPTSGRLESLSPKRTGIHHSLSSSPPPPPPSSLALS